MLSLKITRQSAGTLSPAFNRIISPMTNWVESKGCSTPSRITAALSGTNARNCSINESDFTSEWKVSTHVTNTTINNNTPIYRLAGSPAMIYKMMQSKPVIISNTMRRLVNCNRKINHRGTFGGGVKTFGPIEASKSAAFFEGRPLLLVGSAKSIWVRNLSASTSMGNMCSKYAPAAPFPPVFSRASSAFSNGGPLTGSPTGMILGKEEAEILLTTAI
mmetsp:Transcript_27603/g.30132  ORF Transcript_27603/g.30132 Transcript_27603/m.30132 type:complete len:218 (-) Transcript_27603:237-890(-)